MKEKKLLKTVSQYYIGGIVAYVILAIVAAKFLTTASFQIASNYLTNNPLLSLNSTSFTAGTRVIATIQYRWILVILMALSIIVPAVYVYLIQNNVKKIDLHKFRFIDWIVTGTLITLLIATLSGIQDIMNLLLIAGLSLISYYLFWIIINDKSNKFNGKLYIIGLLSAVLPWIVILFYAFSTIVYGSIRTPWYVYATYIIGLVNLAIILYGYNWHKKIDKTNNALEKEIYPILANQIVKIIFVLILVIGLKR